MDDNVKLRRAAAEAGKAYLTETLSWEQFMDAFGESEDELVSELVDLIEHEPKRGGFLGLSGERWAEYQSQLTAAITAHES